MLDGEGGHTVYGKLAPAEDSLKLGGFPLGLAHNVKLVNPVAAGQPVRWTDVQIDAASEAVRLRREVLRLDDASDAYRFVHAEGDGLSGIVIDKMGEVLSVECFSAGMYQRAEAIVELFDELHAAGQTIVMITHDQTVAKLASRVVQIRDGQIVEDTKAA